MLQGIAKRKPYICCWTGMSGYLFMHSYFWTGGAFGVLAALEFGFTFMINKHIGTYCYKIQLSED